MENICIRLDSGLSKRIEKEMKEFNYSTKTDFVRDAIRVKLRELDAERDKKNRAWEALFAARGALKGTVPPRTAAEERELEKKIDQKVRRHYEKKFGISLK